MSSPKIGKLAQRKQAEVAHDLMVRDRNPSLVTAIKLVISRINSLYSSLQSLLVEIIGMETFARSLNASYSLAKSASHLCKA